VGDSILVSLMQARESVGDREADLRAARPPVALGDELRQLDQRLESVLRCGARVADCQAAALYLLDELTSALKLRACWGLPIVRLLQPPRPLAEATADLEAMVGHAVALERASSFGPWQVPEEFAAAVCVPVASPTVVLGTLWLLADRPRAFSDRDTNLAELVAGWLAAELDRAMLLAELRRRFPRPEGEWAASGFDESRRPCPER